MKLLIVRHGLTNENKFGICQGQKEGTLSAEGILKNNQLSFDLKNTPIDVFYSSTLSRAKDTLFQILTNHRDKQVIFDSRLNEWGMGKLEGKPFPENFSINNKIEDFEKFEDAQNRCLSFLNEIKIKHPNQTILAVSHGLIIKMMESILLKIDFNETKLFENSSQKTYSL